MGIVIGVVVAVVVVAAFVALYVKVRHFERDVEVPTRELTDEEKNARMVQGSAATNIASGINGGGGGI